MSETVRCEPPTTDVGIGVSWPEVVPQSLPKHNEGFEQTLFPSKPKVAGTVPEAKSEVELFFSCVPGGQSHAEVGGVGVTPFV